jgi:hypothetical protein
VVHEANLEQAPEDDRLKLALARLRAALEEQREKPA